MTGVIDSITLANGDVIVLLNWSGQAATFCNLQRRNAADQVIWTATPPHPLDGVWTALEMEGRRLIAYSFSGYNDEIDCDPGRVLARTFTKYRRRGLDFKLRRHPRGLWITVFGRVPLRSMDRESTRANPG